MDRKTEKFLMDLLFKIKSASSVTYKWHTVGSYADYIYVLEDKKLIVSGNPEELVQIPNFYIDFFDVNTRITSKEDY